MCARKEICNKPIIKRVNSVIFRSNCSFSFKDHEEVIGFLKNNFIRQEIEGFYFDEQLKNFVVKFINDRAFSSCIGNTYYYTLSNGRKMELVADVADDFVHCVKLFNVPLEISDKMVMESIGKFGKVYEIQKDTSGKDEWTVPNGNRIVYMEIEDKLPILLEIAGQRVKVFSTSLTKVCFCCGGKDHSKNNCVKNQFKQQKSNGKVDTDKKSKLCETVERQPAQIKQNDIQNRDSSGKVSNPNNAANSEQDLVVKCSASNGCINTVSLFAMGTCVGNVYEPAETKEMEIGTAWMQTTDDKKLKLLINVNRIVEGKSRLEFDSFEKGQK